MTQRKNPLATIVVWLGLILGATATTAADRAAPAAATAAGTITGRVQYGVTGQYLNNARVVVRGTSLMAFTDDTGTFRLAGVPSGPVVLQVFYTGLEPQEVAANVAAGGSVQHDVSLGARDNAEGRVVRMGSFAVSDSREMDAETIAVNEQRFSPNIKNVVAAGSFGDIAEGNLGEFMKYLPGVTADFADPTILSISVRGLNAHTTTVTADGAQMANAHYGGSTRVFQFEQVSINNIARVELTKVPTPSQPADTLGGNVNMVSKSAFERTKAHLSYRLYATANYGDLTLRRQPHSSEERRYRVLPSADFNYTLPINNRFGLVVSGLTSNTFNDLYVSARVYNATAPGSGATFARPYLQQQILQDAPRYTHRHSGSLKADWRVTPNSVLSASFQRNKFWSFTGMYQLTSNVGANGAPTPATGVALTFGPDFTNGANGRGGITMDGQFLNIRGDTKAGNVRYRFDNGGWKIDANASRSASKTIFADTDRGHFFNTTSQLVGPVRIVYTGITNEGPTRTQVLNNANQEVDFLNLNNYRLANASSQLRDLYDDVTTFDASVRRQINPFGIRTSVQLGGAYRLQEKDVRRQNIAWTYNGPDGNPNTPESPAPYQAREYANRDSGFGFVNVPWVSPNLAWRAFQQNPALFSKTAAQRAAEETFRLTNSEAIDETVTAGYAQGEARLFRNRLNVLTGLRYEKTTAKGRGVLFESTRAFVRDPDGTFAHTPGGALIRRPEAGAAGSVDEVRLTRIERGSRAQKSYDGWFPSLHFTYHAKENFLVRLAYAATYGRPNFNQIIPNATVNEFDSEDGTPDAFAGTISLRNPALKPWTADNYDLSLEYYTGTGGVLSAGAFRKDVRDFFTSDVRIATVADLQRLDLDPRYVGWQITTQRNAGRARISGLEINLKQSLAPLGRWGKPWELFANGTKLDLDADGQPSFGNTITGSANWGFTFTLRKLMLMAKWNYRGRVKGTSIPGVGPDGFQWDQERTTLDLNLDYRLTRRLGLFANARNALNENPAALRYSSQTPEYAQQFRVQKHGGQYSLGLKGSF